MDRLRALLAAVSDMLTGEPARAISYGAAVIIYIVARATGLVPDLSFDQAVLQAGAAALIVVTITETIRHYVSSPNTVAAIMADLARASLPKQ